MKISSSAWNILNGEALIEKRNRWFAKLLLVFIGKESREVLAVNGIRGETSLQIAYEDPEQWVVEALENLAGRIACSDNDIMFIPACIEYSIYGVHFIDKILGAEVFFQDDQWYNRYLKTPIGCLAYPDLDNNPTWHLAQRATHEFLRQDVKLPLFGLPAIASALNIAVNLYGQEILLEILTEPDNALKDLRTINSLICNLHRWYRSVVPLEQLQPVISWNRTQPPGFGQICGCTSQLVSGATYREFIEPLDSEALMVYPNGGMMHLCGSHTQHLETFRNMKALRAVQINDRAAWDLEKYFHGLREDQIIYLYPCEGMTVEMAMEITGGHRLVIADNISATILRKGCKCTFH